jgi:hypothetical protein
MLDNVGEKPVLRANAKTPREMPAALLQWASG